MKVKMLGAAREVTGSCFLVETPNARFAVDCGLHQGGPEKARRNQQWEPYDPARIDFFIITHAHIDHSGLLPRMVKKGFRGPIYTTAATRDLLEIMLLDSAHIQEMEAQWKTVKRMRKGEAPTEPLYTVSDAQKTLPLIRETPYATPVSPSPGITFTLHDAGHILGAGIVELTVTEGGVSTCLVFSGDIGRPAQLLVKDPSRLTRADYLFIESTYGQRNHKNEDDSLAEFAEAINYSYSRKEKVIIPAFAVARTQEVIYSLYLLHKKGLLPQDMPIYIDSPLAIKATQIFRKHRAFFDEETQALFHQGENPLALKQLYFTETREESAKINNTPGPAVVISASGMADAGRIKHHLRHNLWRPGSSIVFVGFQAEGTVGRRLVDGAKRISLFGEDIAVKARIFTINGFSGHAGQSQLLDWLGHFQSPHMKIFLVHGEYPAQLTLAERIREKYPYQVYIPDYLEELYLPALPAALIPEPPPPAIPWEEIFTHLAADLKSLEDETRKIAGAGPEKQAKIKGRIDEIQRMIRETARATV